jgi:hypothetical protein
VGARRDDATAVVDVYAVVAEVDRIAATQTLWPNFDPRRVPVEIYDGQTTLLFRHPAPPKEFVSLSSHQGVWAFAGRHETVTANAPAKLNGVLTATVMLKPGGRQTLRDRAALVVHEMFHAFQRERHAAWQANELDLFAYPFDDAEALRLRRLESEALRRAADAAEGVGAHAQAGLALLALIEEHGATRRLPADDIYETYQRADALLRDVREAEATARLRDCARVVMRRMAGPQLGDPGFTMYGAVHEFEARIIERALEAADGSVTHAARVLGLSHQTLGTILNTRHKHLATKRTPVRRRLRSIIKRPKVKPRS